MAEAVQHTDEDKLMEEHCEPEDGLEKIKRNLLSDLLDDSPVQGSAMPPPALPTSTSSTDTEKMKVFLRIRPLKEEERRKGEDQGCVVVVDASRVDMIAPRDSRTYEHSAHGCGKLINTFNFSRVYGTTTTQRELFESCMHGTVKDFVDGQNCLVFAYGVTNSGKTYTVQGTPKDPGILPRSLEVIFNSIEGKQVERADLRPQLYCGVRLLTNKELAEAEKFKATVLSAALRPASDSDLYSSNESLASQSSLSDSDSEPTDTELCDYTVNTEAQGNIKFSVWVCFSEIYNEQVYDLLEPLPKTIQKRKGLQMREDRNGNPYIKDLRHIHVANADEAIKVLTFGQKNLQYACTKLNESSSRSHCIFTIKMLRVVDKDRPRVAQMNMLSFCDLAGSERYNRTQSSGDRLKEAANINTSLLTLGRCIQLLRQNQLHKLSQRVVPFRDSKLTRLFQSFFAGKGKASMLVNINPSAAAFDENIHALKFSAMAKHVQFIPEKVPEVQRPKGRTDVSLALARMEECAGRPSIPWATEDELREMATMETVEKIEEEEQVLAGAALDTTLEMAPVQSYLLAIDKLKAALLLTSNELQEEKRSKRALEASLREEICKEMMAQITEIENRYEEQLEEERARYEDVADKKIAIFQEAVTKSVKRKRHEFEEAHRETVSLSLLHAEQVKLQHKENEIDRLTLELADAKKANENYRAEILSLSAQVNHPQMEPPSKCAAAEKTESDSLELEILQDQVQRLRCDLAKANKMADIAQVREAEIEELKQEIRALKQELSARDSLTNDIAQNEIFINLTNQLTELNNALVEQKNKNAELAQTVHEAGEIFTQKDNELHQKQCELLSKEATVSNKEAVINQKDIVINQKEAEILALKEKLAGMGSAQIGGCHAVYQFTGTQQHDKENLVVDKFTLTSKGPTDFVLPKLHKSAKFKPTSTSTLGSSSAIATPVSSTCGTPYKAMHTKSSLLRLKNICSSPAKIDKCLDQSCFANDTATQGRKRKSGGLEADTRATKKRKAAVVPGKKRVSNILRRIYETRSRVKVSSK